MISLFDFEVGLECRFSAQCICEHKNPVETTKATLFGVYDPSSDDEKSSRPCRIVHENDGHLSIVNEGGVVISLLKTDKCFLPDGISKCDCMLHNSVKLFFVEIKRSNSAERGKQRNKAIEQLASTILYFQLEGYSLSMFQQVAVICFVNRNRRITRAASQEKRDAFFKRTKVALVEGNHIEF